jgi:hypothetical protein
LKNYCRSSISGVGDGSDSCGGSGTWNGLFSGNTWIW